jgi:hypothetical protein
MLEKPLGKRSLERSKRLKNNIKIDVQENGSESCRVAALYDADYSRNFIA